MSGRGGREGRGEVPITRRARTTDSASRAQFLKLAFWVLPVLTFFLIMLIGRLYGVGSIGPTVYLLSLILALPLSAGTTLFIWWIIGRLSTGLGATLYAAGNLTPAPSFSREESLIVRGLYAEAAKELRARIAAEPEAMEARLRLAEVCRRHLQDPSAAREALLQARQAHPGPRHEWQITSALLELYRQGGEADRGRLMAELARCAERYGGTPQGEGARKELHALKEKTP